MIVKKMTALQLEDGGTSNSGLDHQNNSSNRNKENSIIQYLEQMPNTKSMILFKWNSSGILERATGVGNHDWFKSYVREELFHVTEPSEHGKAALVLNDDIIGWVDWEVNPPIPLLAFSLPNNKVHHEQYRVIPNPYDRDGFNKWMVDEIQKAVVDSKTYEDFHKLQNVIIWRGALHYGMDSVRGKLVAMSDEQKEDERKWLDAGNTQDSSKHMDAGTMAKNYKYHIDIGGASGTTWGALRWKMCTGRFVFKVDTFASDWWHDTLEPWKHYVPVKDDLSDLYEKYLWAERNPNAVYEIAQSGMDRCLKSHYPDLARIRQMEIVQSLPGCSAKIMREVDELFDNHVERYFLPLQQ
jgi:Glycosyl transferase family 90